MKNIVFWVNNLGEGGAQRVVSVLANKLCEDNNVTVVMRADCLVAYDLNPNIKTVFIKDYRMTRELNFFQRINKKILK